MTDKSASEGFFLKRHEKYLVYVLKNGNFIIKYIYEIWDTTRKNNVIWIIIKYKFIKGKKKENES